MNEDEFQRLQIGDRVVISSDINTDQSFSGLAIVPDMLHYRGEIVTVKGWYDNGRAITIKEHDYYWTKEMLECKVESELKEDDREYKNFKIGDLVKIRSEKDLKEHFRSFNRGCFATKITFTKDHKKFIEQRAVIQEMIDDVEVKLRFLDYKKDEYSKLRFSTDMLEIVEENYIEKNAKVKKVRKPRMMTEDDIVKEMIEKVDKDKLKKILASAFRMKATSLNGIDLMLENWARAKKDIYILFGKKLKLEEDIEYEADSEAWEEYKNEIIKKFPITCYIFSDIPLDQLQKNEYRPFSSYLHHNVQGAKQGMKLTTFLSKAVNNPEFDLEFSKIIDNSKIKGKINISIDPIDFLLMSFNNSGWSSCHTISHHGESRNFGEWSAGIFSYIGDKTTVISYRHSGKIVNYKIGSSHFEDISKNWRELIYIDTNTYAFCASRQYPRYDEEISKKVRSILEETICQKLNIENKWKVEKTKSGDFASTYIEDSSSEPLHYNDMLHGFEGKFVWNKELNNFEKAKMTVGCSPVCPICGRNSLYRSGLPVCSECRNNW